jgi:hypothetical protein
MSEKDSSTLTIESPLAIDRGAYATLGETRAYSELQGFARSTRVKINQEHMRLMLCGTDLAHHAADPHLFDSFHMPPVKVCDDEYAEFHVQLSDYDLCMEDSWTGYLVSRHLTEQNIQEPLVFIHLDDHTDMMSTLLARVSNRLMDPEICKCFDPRIPTDWEAAIRSGSVGIGSFVTALYYLPQPVHVIHLNHFSDSLYKRSYISHRTITHPLLPHAHFTTIQKQSHKLSGRLGTYIGGSNVQRLLNSIPRGHVIVHIDLDYFINDYNGNVGTVPAQSVAELHDNATILMTAFFEALFRTGVTVERWVIATSPGFCSSRHWRWFLDELSSQIKIANQQISQR